MKFKLNCIDWELIIVPQNDPRLTLDGCACYGVTNIREQTIYIDGSLSKIVFKQTVIHELIHAFKWSYGVHFPTSDEEDIDESLCDFMGAHLCSVYGLTKRIMKEYYGGVDDV